MDVITHFALELSSLILTIKMTSTYKRFCGSCGECDPTFLTYHDLSIMSESYTYCYVLFDCVMSELIVTSYLVQ